MSAGDGKRFLAVADERVAVDGLGCFVETIVCQPLVDVMTGKAPAEPDPEVLILGKVQRLVEASDRLESGTPEKSRRLTDDVGGGQLDKVEICGSIVADDRACSIRVAGISIHKGRIRFGTEKTDCTLQGSGKIGVIGVQPGQ